jgi:hypothetical protein
MTIKIVGIACSPRLGQSTHHALETDLALVKEKFENVEKVMIDLAGMDIRGCVDCGTCMKKITCSDWKQDPVAFAQSSPSVIDKDIVRIVRVMRGFHGGCG